MHFDWSQLVPWIANAIDYVVSHTTQLSPDGVFFGTHILPLADDFHCVLSSKLSDITDYQAAAFTAWLCQFIKTIHKDCCSYKDYCSQGECISWADQEGLSNSTSSWWCFGLSTTFLLPWPVCDDQMRCWLLSLWCDYHGILLSPCCKEVQPLHAKCDQWSSHLA